MKKLLFLVFLLGYVFSINAQIEPDLLVNITSATSLEMQTITTETAGSLVFNSDEGRIYQFDGTNWVAFSLTNPIVVNKTASYQLTELDSGNVFTFNSSNDVILTISTGLPIGFNISVYQIGTGRVNFVGATGVTIKNRLSRFKSAGKDSGAGLICTATNTFHLTGDLKK